MDFLGIQTVLWLVRCFYWSGKAAKSGFCIDVGGLKCFAVRASPWRDCDSCNSEKDWVYHQWERRLDVRLALMNLLQHIWSTSQEGNWRSIYPCVEEQAGKTIWTPEHLHLYYRCLTPVNMSQRCWWSQHSDRNTNISIRMEGFLFRRPKKPIGPIGLRMARWSGGASV